MAAWLGLFFEDTAGVDKRTVVGGARNLAVPAELGMQVRWCDCSGYDRPLASGDHRRPSKSDDLEEFDSLCHAEGTCPGPSIDAYQFSFKHGGWHLATGSLEDGDGPPLGPGKWGFLWIRPPANDGGGSGLPIGEGNRFEVWGADR
jgi:hypothetical protein